MRLAPDGTVQVYTGAQSMGQGIITALAQVAAERVGANFDDVRVFSGDTETTPLGMGSSGSRGWSTPPARSHSLPTRYARRR